jgi:hypothetical protein
MIVFFPRRRFYSCKSCEMIFYEIITANLYRLPSYEYTSGREEGGPRHGVGGSSKVNTRQSINRSGQDKFNDLDRRWICVCVGCGMAHRRQPGFNIVATGGI